MTRPERLKHPAGWLVLVGAVALAGCDADGDGVRRRLDCDDFDSDRYPGAREVCDNKDNDCDYDVDERLDRDWFDDRDSDGVGSAFVERGCEAPPRSASVSGDCNDRNPDVYPGAPEVCDDVDNDCDGFVDVDGAISTLYYPDDDADGFGDRFATELQCRPIPGWVATNTDCNDNDADVSPNAVEVCDGKDNDCDGSVDENGGCR